MIACQQWRAISLSVPPPVVVVLRSEDGFENDGDKERTLTQEGR